jgi:8-hydroxy-5-deazaflavin:NADPH oxidoreductase
MDIGIVGTGNMALALGEGWLRAGHRLYVGGRDLARARAVAGELGGGTGAGGIAAAAGFGDVVLVAIAHSGVLAAARAAGELAGRIVLDCTNPVVPADGFRLADPHGPSVAEQIAAITGAEVVKAFNLGSAELWRVHPPTVDGRPLVVPFAAPSDRAALVAQTLISDLGCRPLHLGGTAWAGTLEAVAALGIRLLVTGIGLESVLPATQPGPPPGDGVSGREVSARAAS